MDKVECKELIICSKKRLGKGNVKHSPIRVVTEVFTKDGQLVASSDPRGGFSIEHMIGFARICRNEPEKTIEELMSETYGPDYDFLKP